jgi:tRNA nucleotidyltransferase (CCA-adding enzyme)
MKKNIWSPRPLKNNLIFSPKSNLFKKPKKRLTYPEAVIRYPRLSPFGDADKDGKINMFDCRPFNKMKHTTISFKNKKIRIETPKQVRPIIDILNKKGRAYVVGGFVRDTLLKRPPKDVDIEVHGMTPETISKELQSAGYNVNEVGKSFGVLKVSPKTGSRRDAIDVSVPRMDSTGRKPTIKFLKNATPKEAAKRRDFTINAIMYDTKEDKVVDPYEGLKDLDKGQIKAVSDQTFSDDPLRVVRAAQFASRFDFNIAPETVEAARKANMKELSGERIREELEKVSSKAKKPSKFFVAMDEMGQLETIFPEVAKMRGVKQDPKYHPEGDVFQHTMQVIDKVAKSKDKNPKLILMGVLHDTGKVKAMQIDPKTGKISALGHAEESAKIAEEFMDRLKYPTEEKQEIVNLVEHHMEPHHLALAGATKFRHKNRLLAKVAGGYNKLASNPEKAIERYKNIIKFAKEDNPNEKYTEIYEELEKIPPAEKYHREAKGEDIVAEGYKGKEVGERLEELYKNQIANIEEEEESEPEEVKVTIQPAKKYQKKVKMEVNQNG